FAMQNANGDLRRFLSDTVALVQAPTHDAQAELVIEDGVDRSVRYRMELLQRLVGIQGNTCGIAQQQEKKDIGIWWQRRDSLLHLVEGEIAVVGEFNPSCEWLGCLLKHVLPKMFERRRSYYHRDIFCRRRNLQHVFNEAGNLIYLPDVSRILLQRAGRQ